MMVQYELENGNDPSWQDSLEAIESDIQHANMLAASISRSKGCPCVQMKLMYSNLAPIFFFLLQWFDCSCTYLLPTYLSLFHILVYNVDLDSKRKFPSHGRKATVDQFYGVILPYLENICNNSMELDSYHEFGTIIRKNIDKNNDEKYLDINSERDDECGICLERCTKMMLPNCYHEMCINCYRDWNTRSASCPFCRGSLKRVNSGDLWVMTSSGDVVDQETLSKDDMLRFCLYINNLPKDIPDALFLFYYEYLF